MGGVEAPGPLNGAGIENERATGGPVEGEAIASRTAPDVLPVIEQELRNGLAGLRHVYLAGRPEPVVDVHIPLVAQRLAGHGIGLTRLQICYRGISPERQLGIGIRHLISVRTAVHQPELAGQRVFRLPAVTGRAEPRISPLAGPGGRVGGVGLGAVYALLVRDQRSVCLVVELA